MLFVCVYRYALEKNDMCVQVCVSFCAKKGRTCLGVHRCVYERGRLYVRRTKGKGNMGENGKSKYT